MKIEFKTIAEIDTEGLIDDREMFALMDAVIAQMSMATLKEYLRKGSNAGALREAVQTELK